MRLRRSRLSDAQTLRLLEHFVAGTPARVSAQLAGVNRNTATRVYRVLRELIARHAASKTPQTGASPPARQAGESAYLLLGEVPRYRLAASGSRVYVQVLPRMARAAPEQGGAGSLVIGESGPGPGRSLTLKRAGAAVPGGKGGMERIGTIENFWSQTLRCLRRYNGVPEKQLDLFMRECEWRFNHGSPRNLLATLVDWISSDST
jgi:transposase